MRIQNEKSKENLYRNYANMISASPVCLLFTMQYLKKIKRTFRKNSLQKAAITASKIKILCPGL